MPKKLCCPECFGDRWLRSEHIPSKSTERGKCDFCSSEESPLIDPIMLAAEFEAVVNVYEPDPDGKTLVELMKEDWQLFPGTRLDSARASQLLGEILDDGNIVRKAFSPSRSYTSNGLVQWDSLRDEMMFKNRWFLEHDIDRERLTDLLSMLLETDAPKLWYRARIQTADNSYTIGEMNAPPKHLASHGRANPAGIPYLYLGSQPDTAAAEIRPHTGEVACIADFTIPVIRAVDLRNPRGFVSPFVLGEASKIGQLRADLPLLERLGGELTRPVLPHRAAIDYIPSQYLCEFIKQAGFDGVIYRSSVSEGMNLALFNPNMAVGGNVSLYNITKVSVDIMAL